MIDFIKKHKIAFIVGFVVILLYWLYKRGTASTSTAAPQDATAAYLAGLSQPSYMTYGAGGGTLSGSANVQPLVPLMNAVNQPGTSASGVPSFSNQTQEMTPNTPAPAVA
ncbi:MAG TPA: hypothetical protein VET48_11235, partial [Steroidobacteraceae bacterium]|nr:hypothetical protein [Steroidobacteraceae bacterium]